MLLVVQVAMTCTVVINVVSLIAYRVRLLQQPSGIDETHLAVIESERVMPAGTAMAPAIAGDLEALRHVTGVLGVSVVDAIPFGRNDWINGFTSDVIQSNDSELPTEIEPSLFDGSSGTFNIFGLRLVRGVSFAPEDFLPLEASNGYAGLQKARVAIVTEAFARRMFPTTEALGRFIYADGHSPIRIIGIVDHLARPNLTLSDDNELSVLLPLIPDKQKVLYLLKTTDGPEDVIERAKAALLDASKQRIFHRTASFRSLKKAYFRRDASMIAILVATAVALVFVNLVGVMGLVSFWVGRRTRQIGIRRALGATRGAIMAYFLVENLVVVGAGALLGAGCAMAVNRALMTWFEVPHLPWPYLPAGWLTMIVLGQLAALVPATTGASVAPSVAIRG
jgi:putative ABC transport system permease protein